MAKLPDMGALFQFQQIPFQLTLLFPNDKWRALLCEQLLARM